MESVTQSQKDLRIKRKDKALHRNPKQNQINLQASSVRSSCDKKYADRAIHSLTHGNCFGKLKQKANKVFAEFRIQCGRQRGRDEMNIHLSLLSSSVIIFCFVVCARARVCTSVC